MFVDEKGARVSSDVILSLLGRRFVNKEKELHTHRKPAIIHDLRASKVVAETVTNTGGVALMTKVGRPSIIDLMRRHNSPFGGELSGHYFFGDFYSCDDGLRTLVEILNVLCEDLRPLSEIAQDFAIYSRNDELNVTCANPALAMTTIQHAYPDAQKVLLLDGVSIYFETFWFNVRMSNTEPLLRINLEADTQEILTEQLEKLKKIIAKAA